VVFDVSHLGTVRVSGEGSYEHLQSTLTNDLAKVAPGRAQYTHLLGEDASVLDDIIVWWRAPEFFDVMPNASNTERVVSALGGEDVTAARSILAVQGPGARAKLAALSDEVASVRRFDVRELTLDGTPIVVAGTGYTGEDGVELSVPNERAEEVFARVLDAGVTPAGLGARDTLRLEAGLPLHGHELGPGITPLQAGLGWVVGWDKPAFLGRAALLEEREQGPRRRLVGLKGSNRQPFRDGARVLVDGVPSGVTSSGNFSPMLEVGIALAFLDAPVEATLGQSVEIDVRGRMIPAEVTSLPFWKRS